jgi:hypothetical protein
MRRRSVSGEAEQNPVEELAARAARNRGLVAAQHVRKVVRRKTRIEKDLEIAFLLCQWKQMEQFLQFYRYSTASPLAEVEREQDAVLMTPVSTSQFP